MQGTETSIRIKLGELEVEYKGDHAFVKADLLKFVEELIQLQKDNPSLMAPLVHTESTIRSGASGGGSGPLDLSTDTIANLLSASSGADLVIAAAANLHFTQGKTTFLRQEIIDEMRKAVGHYRDTFVPNLTKYLSGLTKKDRLRRMSDDKFALSNAEKQALEKKLASA
jgi:hypothetical protein